MPTLAATQVPPPSHWQDFEHLCCDLYRRLWGDPGTQRNGRTGQAQHGVDVFGRPGGGGSFAGVQCKLKNELVAGTLTAETLEEEAGKAKEKFRPRLASFLVATTGPRDAAAQEAARLLTAADPAFPVAVVSWEEIVSRRRRKPEETLLRASAAMPAAKAGERSGIDCPGHAIPPPTPPAVDVRRPRGARSAGRGGRCLVPAALPGGLVLGPGDRRLRGPGIAALPR